MAITGQSTRTPEEDEEYERWSDQYRESHDAWLEGLPEDERNRVLEQRKANRASDENRTVTASPDYDPLTGAGTGPRSGVSDFDQSMEGIPILDWITGADDRRGAARAADEQQKNEMAWQSVGRAMPSVNDLTPTYQYEGETDEYGNLIGGPSQLEGFDVQSGDQRYAMDALRNLYERGGYTDADYAARRQASMERGQQLRGANEAALQQSYARGMGGSGQEMLARLNASQGMAQGQAMSDAAIQQAAMQRALASLQNYHQGANQQQSMEFDRRRALDSFNQSNTDWRRGRESRNTDTANTQQDANTGARQQAWENRYRTAQGYTNRYPGAGQNQQDSNEDEAGLLGFIGEIIG